MLQKNLKSNQNVYDSLKSTCRVLRDYQLRHRESHLNIKKARLQAEQDLSRQSRDFIRILWKHHLKKKKQRNRSSQSQWSKIEKKHLKHQTFSFQSFLQLMNYHKTERKWLELHLNYHYNNQYRCSHQFLHVFQFCHLLRSLSAKQIKARKQSCLQSRFVSFENWEMKRKISSNILRILSENMNNIISLTIW